MVLTSPIERFAPHSRLVPCTIHDSHSPGVPMLSLSSDRYLTACTDLVHCHYLGPCGEHVPVLTLLIRPPPAVEGPTHKVVGFRYDSDTPGTRSSSCVCERGVREGDHYMDSVYASISRNEAFVAGALSFFIALELGFPLAPLNIAHYLGAPS